MAVTSLQSLVDMSETYGAAKFSSWRKSPTQVTTVGIWFDLSMSPGNPVPQYYAAAPLVAQQFKQSTDGGIFHGADQGPEYKYLRRLMALTVTATALPLTAILLDYLLYYPFIDEGTNDPQTLTNTLTLPRYTDGIGVKIMPVVVGAHTLAAGVQFTCSYTNTLDQSGRTTQAAELTTAQSVNGTIATSARATQACNSPFLTLQSGDKGVKSIQSVTFLSATDVGLITLVLVKPIAQFSLRGIDAPVELDYFRETAMQLPRIVDDAYLNLICCPAGSLAATAIHGTAEFVWG